MDNAALTKVVTNRNVAGAFANNNNLELETTTYKAYENGCRRYIQEHLPTLRDLDATTRLNKIRDAITGYMLSPDGTKLVDGYIKDGRNDISRLASALLDGIANYGILTNAMRDPDVFEIRCNGREIKVEIKGRVQDLRDSNGNIVRFSTPEEQMVVIKKLLGDVRITPKDVCVNAITIEGYRVAAVHSSGTGTDPNDPTAEKFHSFVLRKFKSEKMRLSAIVKYGTLSDNMARLLSLCPKGGLTFVTVGPTASGKTTTNNAILQDVPPTTRTVLLQNPSEIDLRFKDEHTGRITNDVLHLEARQIENPSPTDPTMENMMAHILRLSPTFVCFGELRTNKEFKLGLQIAQAGHPINCTYHAESSKGAIRRFLTAYLAESGNEPSDLALLTLTDLIDLVIVQRIMPDGTRKILQITEVLGVKDDNPNDSNLQDLYIFDQNGDTEYDRYGNISKINGVHKRVGRISEALKRKMRLAGVNNAQFDFIDKPVDINEEETYTGENVENYNVVLGV